MLHETVDLGNSTVESHNGELVVGDVHDQILAHNGQTDEAKVTTGSDPRGSADIDAGQTCATVSPRFINKVQESEKSVAYAYRVVQCPKKPELGEKSSLRGCGARRDERNRTYTAFSVMLGV